MFSFQLTIVNLEALAMNKQYPGKPFINILEIELVKHEFLEHTVPTFITYIINSKNSY